MGHCRRLVGVRVQFHRELGLEWRWKWSLVEGFKKKYSPMRIIFCMVLAMFGCAGLLAIYQELTGEQDPSPAVGLALIPAWVILTLTLAILTKPAP